MPRVKVSYDLLDLKEVAFTRGPENVIEKLLNEYQNETTKIVDSTPDQVGSDGDALSMLKKAFEVFFNQKARAFGQKTSQICGFSDNAIGVQWNVEFDQVRTLVNVPIVIRAQDNIDANLRLVE